MENINFEYFDIIKYLQARRVEYWEEGKNVSDNWINIQCLFPGCSDPSNHLGINLTSKAISCWMCGNKGSLLNLVLLIDRCDIDNAFKTIKKFSHTLTSVEQRKTLTAHETASKNDFKLPLEAKSELLSLHRDYLTNKRGFDAEYLVKKYDLRCIGPIGTFCNRLLIPYYHKKRLLTFSTRDVTGQSKVPYVHCPKKLSPENPKTMLYNLDTVKDTIVIVEGYFIVFKLGDGVVATSGTKWTMMQVYLCHLLSLKRAFILFDAEEKAQEQAEKLASALSCFINHVEVLCLDKGDLDNLNENEVRDFRKEVFGKIF